jgi:hypothetical protein
MKLLLWDGERQSWEDLGRKFNGTYIKASVVDNRPEVFLVRAVNETVHLRRYVNNVSTEFYALASELDILQAKPEVGVYDLDNEGVVLLRHIPARQWAEGLCRSNTSFHFNGDKPLTGEGIPFDVAHRVFADQQDFTLEQGLSKLKPGKCLRLTGKYWLASNKKDKTTSLFSMRARCGSFAMGQFFWSEKGKNLREELKDELGFHA